MISISPATILIVDDERPNRRLLELLLTHEGYHTVCAASGKEALVLALQRQPDLIMLDLMMPEIDGFQVLVALKADGATSNIPVIVLTAMTDRSARLAGLQAGAEEFLNKPVDREELGLRVRNLLRLKEYSDLMRDHSQVLEREVQARTAEILVLNAELEERVRLRTSELQDANEELEAFSYSVSHDLRGPLASMDGFSTLLARELSASPPGTRAEHCMKRIRAGISDMGHLIDALLSLAQVSRANIKWDRVDLSAMGETILDRLRESDPGRDARLKVQPGMTALGDAHLLRQMLDNLLGNAWKFSAKKELTQIEFTAHTGPQGEVVHEVRDHGAGFDMTYSEKLFSAFQRLHTESEFAGSGIGLATVQRVVRRHGGRVWAESAPDAGAIFRFTLGVPPP